MSRRLWFCMPAAGRLELSRICMTQLAGVCDELQHCGIEAEAVVIADDENLDTARSLGFGTIERDNRFLARKYNDGLQLACDPDVNAHPADYAVPIGSDDWIDHRILHRLPAKDAVLGFRHVSFVSEDGMELTETRLAYDGGVGIRVYPAALLEVSGYRPADEDRKRACDTSILYNTQRNYMAAHGGRQLRITYGDLHPHQIVDWKTPGVQMNAYAQVAGMHRGRAAGDPWTALKGIYDQSLLHQMQEHYAA